LFDDSALILSNAATAVTERIAKEAISNKIIKESDSNKKELGGGGPEDHWSR
jgi:hypothetical protein